MTRKEYDQIKQDNQYLKIEYRNGVIYMKEALYKLREKAIQKAFKGRLYSVSKCDYVEAFMKYVSLLYRQLDLKRKRLISAGYTRIWSNEGGYEWKEINDYDS